jgi:hypothetical protein
MTNSKYQNKRYIIETKSKKKDKNQIIKISNYIGIFSIVLLIYWIFIFVAISIFDLKIFQKNITEIFLLSIFGILALLFGSLMINIMFNLSKISESIDKQEIKSTSKNKLYVSLIIFILSFPLMLSLLFIGDKLNANKKKNYLISSASQLIYEYPQKIDLIMNYSFDKKYLETAETILNIFSKTDINFPYMSIIVKDTVQGLPIFLKIRDLDLDKNNQKIMDKIQYIYSCSKEERDYLNSVFYEKNSACKFNYNNGNYELFFPVKKNNKIIVIYLTKSEQYGY